MRIPGDFISWALFPGILWISTARSWAEPDQDRIPRFEAQEIDATISIGYGVAVADVDGDGKPDILLADKEQVVWYQNPHWKKHVMTGKLTPRDHVCIAAADIDGDGKAEVAVGAEWNPGDTLNSGSVHYLLPPQDRTQLWKDIPLPHQPTVHRMRWSRSGPESWHLVVLPLHGRGNVNGSGDGVSFLAYQKPDDPTKPWEQWLLNPNTAWHLTHNLDPVNWDDDPEEELLVAAREGIFLIDGKGSNIRQIASAGSGGAGEVRAGKLPGKTRFVAAVEPMHGSTLAVYTAPPKSTEPFWKRTVLQEDLNEAHALACGDFLGSGSDQIVVGWRAMMRPGKVGVKIFAPLDGEGTRWASRLIDDNTMACEDLCLADLNGDGKLDIVASGRATRNVKIYWNRGLAKEEKTEAAP